MNTAKVFQSGNSQAIRLPNEFRLNTNKVLDHFRQHSPGDIVMSAISILFHLGKDCLLNTVVLRPIMRVAPQMRPAMVTIKKPPVYRAMGVQAALLLPLCALLSLYDQTAGFSALLGGLLCLVPHAYFTVCAFRYTGARAAEQVVRDFYRGETGKYALTLAGFALVFALVRPLNVAALFGVYGGALLLQWLTSARAIEHS